MKKFVSIKTKLIANTMAMVVTIFITTLLIIAIMNFNSIKKNSQKTENNIRQSIIAKGKILTRNNSIAMIGMAEDNAFTAISDLVASTVKDDNDIIYGIYMNEMSIPWVYASTENPDGRPQVMAPLKEPIDIWASKVLKLSFNAYKKNGKEIIEFAAPVSLNDEIVGFIRYGISTQTMEKSLMEVKADGRAALFQISLILFFLFALSITGGLITIRGLAIKITNPIGSLVNSTKIIADGSYNEPVYSESNDEIGKLAEYFEKMRATIKKYTDHLQDLVDEKMQQVNDILNNIDEGLFTINLDGSVNKGYSARANEILNVKDIAACSIKQIFHLDEKMEQSFLMWLDLVSKKHDINRWGKLERLAPVHELKFKSFGDINSLKYVSIAFQKVYNKDNKLSKIMILAKDETDKRLKDLQIEEERINHENEVKTILGIVNTPSEEISEFLEDTNHRMEQLCKSIDSHLYKVIVQRKEHPDGYKYKMADEEVDEIYRDIHTIKGNAGSYGFNLLSKHAHKAEGMLEELRKPIEVRRDSTLKIVNDELQAMNLIIQDINEKIKLIFGEDEELTIRVPENRITAIQNLCNKLLKDLSRERVNQLSKECEMLSWKPLKTLFRKYQKVILKAARKLQKKVEVTIVNDHHLYPPNTFSHVDDIILHLTRNAIGHGIETLEVREETGKGIGHIKLDLYNESEKWVLKISDDGKGIDIENLVQKGIEKQILTNEEVQKLNENEKLQLIFRSGFSTASEITDISGRGVGLDVVNQSIKKLGGRVEIDTILGKGTTFTIYFPQEVLI